MLLPLLTLYVAMLRPSAATDLLDDVERRACRFFWDEADPTTSLVQDRARNVGTHEYAVASIASTGYALAALPIAVERGLTPKEQARERALRTLSFILDRMPQQHGWLYHFVEMRTGERVWNCEVSTIDTALLVLGAVAAGQYFHGEVEAKANRLYDRLDWEWVRTNGGAKPAKLTVSHGWKPEGGFLPHDWDSYCELPLLYLLGLGAKHGLPASSWKAWKREPFHYGGLTSLAGGPIFLHEMAFGWFNLEGMRDRLGWDYWVSASNGVRINRQFCIDHPERGYASTLWGLNASDGPGGYNAYGVPSPEDGTLSPTGALAAITFLPAEARAAAEAMQTRLGTQGWGRYGFADAFNAKTGWTDPDVIGIDLGMALIAIENHHTGLIWRLIASHPFRSKAYHAAGLRKTTGQTPRTLNVRR